MKKNLFLIIILTVCSTFTFSQTRDSITTEKILGGYAYYQDGKRLSVSQLAKVMEPNPQAYQQIKSAQSNYTLASIIGGIGGGLVGWPIGSSLAGGDANWTLAGIGAGLIVVSLPISQKFNKEAKQAVDNFNGTPTTTSFWQKRELNLAATRNGVGFTMKL